MALNEADTRSKLIDPKLYQAGWKEDTITREYAISAGTIIYDGKKGKREQPEFADYILRYKCTARLAVVEAKKEELSALEGYDQAKRYAKKIGIPFAYATNGHEIEFINLLEDKCETVNGFHEPEELWQLYLDHLNIVDQKLTNVLIEPNYEEIKIGKRKIPRYYQENAVEKILEAIVQKKRTILVNMATGTGKTFTSVQTIYKLWRSKTAKKILFLVDRNILADQAFKEFDSVFENGACWRLKPEEETFNKSRSIYFGIYQTLLGEKDGLVDRKYKDFESDFFDLIVIDECHRGASNKESEWFILLKYFSSAIQIGLTATPKRDESANTYKYFGEPVITYSLKEGISDGYLAPYIIKKVKSNIDIDGIYVDNLNDVRGQKIESHQFSPSDLEKKISIPTRTKFYAEHLVNHLIETDLFGKTIVFCIDRQHALDMCKYVNEAYLDLVRKYDLPKIEGFSVRITGADSDSNGKYPSLEKFRKIDSPVPVVVTTSMLLTTGVDIKSIKNIVIFREIRSISEFKQIIGRGTRIYENEGAEIEKLGFTILEYGNSSTELFYDPNFDGKPSKVINEQLNGNNGLESSDKKTNNSGIFDSSFKKKIKYRMSNQFYKDQVTKSVETITLVDGNGNIVSEEDYLNNQKKIILEILGTYDDFTKEWVNPGNRARYLKNLKKSKISIKILTDIVTKNLDYKNIDVFDILLNIAYEMPLLTKFERVHSHQIHSNELIASLSDQQQNFTNIILEVYVNDGYNPLEFTPNFFKISKFQEVMVNNLNDALEIFNNKEQFKLVIEELNNLVYR